MVGGFGILASCLENIDIVIKTGTVSIVNDNGRGIVTANKYSENVGDIVDLTITQKNGFDIDTVKANGILIVGPNSSFELIEGENKVVVTFIAKEVTETIITKTFLVKTLPNKIEYSECDRFNLTCLVINRTITTNGVKGEPLSILDFVTDSLDKSILNTVGEITVNVIKDGSSATSFKAKVKKIRPSN